MIRSLLLGPCLAIVLGPALAGQPEASLPGAAGLAEELQELNLTLLEIKELLQQQLEGQSVDLLFKRTELASRNVKELEARLRGAEEQRRSAQEEKERMEQQLKTFAEDLEASGSGLTEEQLERYRSQIGAEVERTARRARAAEAEILELQQELGAEREDLQGWQDLLDRRLGGL